MSAPPIFTEHFVLSKMTAADGEKYYRLSNNDNVMKFVTGHALSREESDKMLSAIVAEYHADSILGRYLVEDRFSGELIGVAKLDQSDLEVEIGYRITEENWGRGVATEIALSLIRFAIDVMKAGQVVAYVNVENHASIRVLEKSGMHLTERIEDIDEIKYRFVYRPSHRFFGKRKHYIIVLIAVIVTVFLLFSRSDNQF